MTKDERFRRLYEMGCIACKLKLGIFRQAQIHHLVDKGNRKASGGDRSTIPLCEFHHQGIPVNDLSKSDTADWLGPSLALEKRAFIAEFGTERKLLKIVDEMLDSIC